MGFLKGKRILITGISGTRSIAYGIAQVMYREGASLAITYQHEKFKKYAEECAHKCNTSLIFLCDVSNDDNIKLLFNKLNKIWDTFDGFIHSIAYVPKVQLDGNYIDIITRNDFNIAHEISSYSFTAMAKFSQHFLRSSSSLITLTYLGSERVVPNYNVMGLAKASLEANTRYMAKYMGSKNIRVNAISAGPVRTLAASGIKNFRRMLKYTELVSPLKKLVSIEEIGNVAAFLASNLSTGITGEIIHVDAGFNILAVSDNEVYC